MAPSHPGKLPRSVSKVMNSRRDLPALPIPQNRRVTALAERDVIERYDRESCGIRALERGDNVITIFDIIGEDFWGEGVTAKGIGRQLKAIGGDVEVQINSPGGDVFEGFAIYNILREHPFNVNVKVLGMAASAASVIAMAGDDIQVGSSAFIMIHNCWVLAVGNRHDMRETADFLEPFDQALADVYVARTGNDEKQVKAWLDAETYMSGKECVDRGFADGLLPSDQITVDEEAKARGKETNAVRAMELTLLASGLSRTQARERIQKVKGSKLDAGTSPDGSDGKPDATENRAWLEAAVGFQAWLKG